MGCSSSQPGALLSELAHGDLLHLMSKAIQSDSNKCWAIGSTGTDDWDPAKCTPYEDKGVKRQGPAALPEHAGVAYACKKGSKKGIPNQDSWFVANADNVVSIYAVLDGHGAKGHDVSNFVRENLPKAMARSGHLATDPGRCLRESFRSVQGLLRAATARSQLNASLSGTTASVVVHRHGDKKLWVAHCGDSRCALGSRDAASGRLRARALTADHKPGAPEEKRRILARGGTVVRGRVYKRGQQLPGLNLSRSLGDLLGNAEAGVSAEPALREVQLERGDEVLLICSDGVWEFISEQEACDIVEAAGSNEEAVQRLVKDAWGRWMQDDSGIADDITAIVVFVNQRATVSV